jgi:hypothetical protein
MSSDEGGFCTVSSSVRRSRSSRGAFVGAAARFDRGGRCGLVAFRGAALRVTAFLAAARVDRACLATAFLTDGFRRLRLAPADFAFAEAFAIGRLPERRVGVRDLTDPVVLVRRAGFL